MSECLKSNPVYNMIYYYILILNYTIILYILYYFFILGNIFWINFQEIIKLN